MSMYLQYVDRAVLTSKANAKKFAEPVVFWLIASRFSLSERAEDRESEDYWNAILDGG